MVFSALVVIFLFLKWLGQFLILRSMQYETFKYGYFQKASRISLHELSIPVNSIRRLERNTPVRELYKSQNVVFIWATSCCKGLVRCWWAFWLMTHKCAAEGLTCRALLWQTDNYHYPTNQPNWHKATNQLPNQPTEWHIDTNRRTCKIHR